MYTYYVARTDHTGRALKVEGSERDTLEAVLALRGDLRAAHEPTALNPCPAWHVQRLDDQGRFAGTYSVSVLGDVRW